MSYKVFSGTVLIWGDLLDDDWLGKGKREGQIGWGRRGGGQQIYTTCIQIICCIGFSVSLNLQVIAQLWNRLYL